MPFRSAVRSQVRGFSEYKHFKNSYQVVPIWVRLQQPKYLAIMGVVIGVPGLYYVTHQDTVPITGRRRFLDLGRKSELEMGREQYDQILNSYRKKNKVLPDNHGAVRRVRFIGNRIAAVTGSDCKDIHWEFNVVEDDTTNAFVLPGGKCIVFTGLLKLFQDDHELATVMAHEIGHAVARHGAENVSSQRFFGFYKVLFALVVGHDLGGFANAAFALVLDLPYSRLMETEADTIGAILMTRACFDPRAGPKTFEKLGALNKSRGIKYFSTHPAPQSRVDDLNRDLPKRMEEFHRNCANRRYVQARRKQAPPKEQAPWGDPFGPSGNDAGSPRFY